MKKLFIFVLLFQPCLFFAQSSWTMRVAVVSEIFKDQTLVALSASPIKVYLFYEPLQLFSPSLAFFYSKNGQTSHEFELSRLNLRYEKNSVDILEGPNSQEPHIRSEGGLVFRVSAQLRYGISYRMPKNPLKKWQFSNGGSASFFYTRNHFETFETTVFPFTEKRQGLLLDLKTSAFLKVSQNVAFDFSVGLPICQFIQTVTDLENPSLTLAMRHQTKRKADFFNQFSATSFQFGLSVRI